MSPRQQAGSEWQQAFASSVLQVRARVFNLLFSLRFLLLLTFNFLDLSLFSRSFLGPNRSWQKFVPPRETKRL